MTVLTEGITGFDTDASIDWHALKASAHSISRCCGYRVIHESRADKQTPNFHTFKLSKDVSGQSIFVACNAHHPVISFFKEQPQPDRLLPCDESELSKYFGNAGYQAISASELMRPVTSNDLSCLSASERKQASYWKPARIVDVVFNWWD
jgi:hypothetical protein